MTRRGPRADVGLLFAARFLRIFAYGFLPVILPPCLHAPGFSEHVVGFLFSGAPSTGMRPGVLARG